MHVRYDDARPLAVRTVRRICFGRDDEACAFAGIARGLLRANGNVVLADARSAVREFDDHGAATKSYGRSGHGPGETQVVSGIASTEGGGLLVLDWAGLHVIQYDDRAQYVSTTSDRLPPDAVDARFSSGKLAFLTMPPADTAGAIVTAHVVSSADTNRMHATFPAGAAMRRGSSGIVLRPPFTPTVLWDYRAPGDVVVTTGTGYALTLWRDGSPVFTVQADVASLPVSAADADSAKDAVRHPGGNGKRSAAMGYNERIESVLENIPRTRPAIARIVLSRDGRIWVQAAKAEVAAATSKRMTRWDVYEANGVLVGFVLLPTTSRLLDVSGQRLLVSDQDPDGRMFAEEYAFVTPA